MKKRNLGLAADVRLKASKNGPAKFSVVAYKGGAMDIEGWDLPVVIDLAGLRFAKRMHANLDHDNTKRVGHVTEHWIHNNSIVLSGVISAASQAAAEVARSARKGFQWQASVEVKPDRVEEINDGDQVFINGFNHEGPIYVTRRGTLMGFAFVTQGADQETEVSVAAQAALESQLERLFDRRNRLRDTIHSGVSEDITEMCLDQLEQVCALTTNVTRKLARLNERIL